MSLQSSIRSAAALVALSAPACSQEGPAPRTPAEPAESQAEKPAAAAEPSQFARFVEVGEDEGKFEVAVTTYRGPEGQLVTLVPAVHIADAAHYRELQELFETYDALLYELVASPDRRPTPGQRSSSGNLLTMFQLMLKNSLELEFQLNAIDYTPDNFVHADLTPETFRKKMEERGETFFTIFFRLLSQAMQQQRLAADEAEKLGPEEPVDLVGAFRRGEGRHTLRMLVARQLKEIEAMAAGAGPGEGTVLLEGRNERAVEVLREQLGAGKKKLGIYYGAAHMPGIERALLEELGFRKVDRRWLTAWDITKRLDPGAEKKKPK